MDCPRCDASLTRYELGASETWACDRCTYVGIPADHRPHPRQTETWNEALERFRRHNQEASESTASDANAVEELIAELTIPGTGDELAHRREAIKTIYHRLKEREHATRADLVADIELETLGYASVDSFWSNTARPVLKALPDIEAPPPGESTWRFLPERS